jgi:hypothetical protein
MENLTAELKKYQLVQKVRFREEWSKLAGKVL